VAGDVSKVSDLVREINAASNEQAQGIGQVNTAVNEMDKVIQQNAASAEESASASEEMNAQALQMKEIVDHMMTLVGGQAVNDASGNRHAYGEEQKKPLQHNNIVRNLVAASRTEKDSSPKGIDHEKANEKYDESLEPRKVIPMDDDFKDF
jgi:methyl-accepting chemotaxis protein